MYIIQEIQTNNGQTILGVPVQNATREAAESVFYTICASAVISSIEKHAIITYTEEGFPIPELTKCFKHAAQPAPAPEPEPEPEDEEDTNGEGE